MVAHLLGDQRGVAVIALGGYARRELCPRSDIDLLLLHDGWPRPGLEALVERLCYPLWDARLTVGHAVRTAREAVADARGRIDTATALLDRRLVAGERGLADALSSEVQRWSRRHGRTLVEQLAAADAQRHDRCGPHPGMLEPDVKNSAGGLRDIHSLRWAAGWLLGDTDPDALVAAGYLSASERRRLAAANDTLLRVRCALHHVHRGGGQPDVLRLEQHDDVAKVPDALAPGGDADDLLREVGLAARAVAHVHNRTWRVVLADARRGRRRRRPAGASVGAGLTLHDGTVEVDSDASVRADPSLALRAVAAAAVHDAQLSRRSATRLADQINDAGPWPWTADTRRALLDTLRAGSGTVSALLDADQMGLLSVLVPQWERIRGHPQRNPLHRFDLDSHLAHAVAGLTGVVETQPYRAAWERLPETDTVVMATWLHDVGKPWPGDHSESGAAVAADILNHMGFDAALVERVCHLVRHHLLYADVATRHDIDDPAEIAAVADVVGDAATADALYLLTAADARATGPAAWSPWKENLVTALHHRVYGALTGDAAPAPADSFAEAATLGATPAQLALLRRHAPAEYVAAADGAQAAVHARLLEHGIPSVDVRAGEVHGTTVVSIVASDRRGLLADCAGVVHAHGGEVVQARALTGPTGTALDWLVVDGLAVDTATVVRDLAHAAAGRLAVGDLAARRRRAGGHRAGAATAAPPRVTVRRAAALEVRAPDGPGVLHRLCAAVADAGFDLAAVRGTTAGGQIVDVFELATPASPAELAALCDALERAATPGQDDVL